MTQATPFVNNLEYLEDGIEILRRRILRLRLRRRLAMQDDEGDPVCPGRRSSSDKDDSHVTPSQLRRRLAKVNRELKKTCLLHARRIAATRALGRDLPLENVVETHKLDEFEKMTILLALAPSIDPSLGNDISVVSRGGRTPEVRDVLEILCDTLAEKVRARRRFTHNAPLVAGNLIELSRSRRSKLSESDFMQMDVEIAERIANRLLGEYSIDGELMSFSHVIEPEIDLEQVVLPGTMREDIIRLVSRRREMLEKRREWGFDRILPYGKAVVMLFSGPSGTGKTMLAHAIAKNAGQPLMLVDIGKLNETGRFEEGLRNVFLEGRLRKAILFFDEADEILADRFFNSDMPVLLREFEKLDGIAILATNRGEVIDEAMERRILCKFEFEVPTPDLRERIWRNHLPPEAPLANDIDFRQLAEEYDFSGGFIKNAVLVALQNALQREGEPRITQADLVFGARQQRMNRLGASVDKRVPKVGLADVVLPENVRRQVEKLVNAARRRGTVFGAWGLGKKLSIGKCVTALFSGPSGVGKTMTAEAVAYELGQVLYPVNLAGVVSKWVGETEKNLVNVFRTAREAGAVLFFDEADAFFGTRLDDGGHHAHYINQQINSLLTEME
ncbi:MAG: ATP-binding protein, partial [Planctomycetes bacterium]|nr:ATP-binding protein [Planctomycetota bacterium]